MKTYEEVLEILGEELIAHVSMNFFLCNDKLQKEYPCARGMHEDTEHPIWRELLLYQNGWIDCMTEYSINV